MHEELIDRIYEASGQPALWPSVLDSIAKFSGAVGGGIIVANTNGNASFLSESLVSIFNAGQKAGHLDKMERSAPMMNACLPQFITDTDFFSAQQMRDMAVYRDLLIPAKMDAGAATVFQGAANDVIVFAIEGFNSHHAARAALPQLDRLRPHLGRALSLSSRAQFARDQAIVETIDKLGSAAAIVSRTGNLRAYSASFEGRLAGTATDSHGRLRFANARIDGLFNTALAGLESEAGGRSLIIRASSELPPCVMHIIPLRRSSRDIFGSDGALLLLADGTNRLLPNGDLLRLLFDLTPAEAQLARALIEHEDLRVAAAAVGTTYETARFNLKRIFQKTGTNRQLSLVRLLSNYGQPGSGDD